MNESNKRIEKGIFMEINLEQIKEKIERRIKNRLEKIDWEIVFGLTEFYIAGNSLNIGKPNDLDLFPIRKNDFIKIKDLVFKNKFSIKSSTKNALTIKHKDRIIQFCNYHFDSLEELVESFDFAHIKIGAKIFCNNGKIFSNDMYMSSDYIESQVVGRTWFTGSSYPLSSLMRLFKYYKNEDGVFRQQFIYESIKILNQIISRGMYSYKDFKEQLDAVDLGLVPEDFKELTKNNDVLSELFSLLKRGDNK